MPPLNAIAVFIQPDLRRKRLQVSLSAPLDAPIRVSIDGTAYSAEGATSPLVIEMPEFSVWSSDSPTCYTAICELPGGPPLHARFGMRECTIKDNRFHLNNKPVTLRGVVLDAQSLGPHADTASARETIGRLKSAGFNFLRAREAAIPEPLIDAADELGLLICDEIHPAWDTTTIDSNLIARWNHPSIVMWHFAGACDDATLRHIHQVDPSRLVFSGLDGFDGSARFLRPYQDDIGVANAITAHLPPPCSNRAERFYENIGETHAPVILASFAPQQIADANARDKSQIENGLAQHELENIFADPDRLLAAVDAGRAESLRLHVQSARVNAKVSSYCVDGVPSGDTSALARVQSPIMLAIRASRTNLVPREEVPVTVTVVNDERIEPIADLSLQVVGPTNQVLWKKKRSIKVPKQTREIWTGTISASGSAGVHKFVVRLMQGMKLLAQNSIDLHVVDPPGPCDVEVSVLDPHGEWTERCTAPAIPAGSKPRVYIVPPLANTIRAYPENELVSVLNEVRAGAVALVFSPPADWNDLASRIEEPLKATSREVPYAYHYARLHPIFDGLPSRCLMLQPYRNVVPLQSFEEQSDERIGGAIALGSGNGDIWWGENIVVRRFGSGRIVFTHARILEYLGSDPIADRLYANMLRHFGRRSVPGEVTQPIHQSVLDWLRRERAERARLWFVVGPFANWDRAGHDTKNPPEQQVDLGAVHSGWRGPVRWTRWYASGDTRFELDLDPPLQLPFTGAATVLPETYYAYAECNAPARQAATLRLRTSARVKAFLNGALVHDQARTEDSTLSAEDAISLTFKQGKNTLLLKLTRGHAPAQMALEFTSATRDPLLLKWWR